MNKIKIFSILSLLLLTTSCFHCPDDEKIGELELTSKSKSFIPYQGDQTLIFISETGEELSFKSHDGGIREENNKISIYKKCTEFKYDGDSTYQYFDSESIFAVYFSEDGTLVINIGLYTNILRPETETFYDKLVVDVTREGTIGRAEIVTDIRFEGDYEESEFNIDSPFEYVSSVTLNGVTYTDIYQSELFGDARIFYNKTQGLVGFITYESVTYNLDRIE